MPVNFEMKICKRPVIYEVKEITALAPERPAPVSIDFAPSLRRAQYKSKFGFQ